MRSVRSACGDETIYLFMDGAKYHYEKLLVQPEFERLDIVPVWNVPYRFEFNAGIERYWAQLKAAFRPLLLKKMLLDKPRRKDTPLKDALYRVLIDVPTTSIRSFIRRGLTDLRTEANEIRIGRGEKPLPEDIEK